MCSNDLVHWRGYSSQHDMWLPLRALSNCLDKAADYLFQNASSRQRDVMIDQFARHERLQLSHLLARAQRTAIRPSNNVMSKPPELPLGGVQGQRDRPGTHSSWQHYIPLRLAHITADQLHEQH